MSEADGAAKEQHLNYAAHGGEGPPALVVHGMLASRFYWDDNLEALAKVCRPVVVELFGHGRSPSPDDPQRYTPASYCDEFERIRRAVSAGDNGAGGSSGAERIWLIGHSLGAALLLHYALAHPDKVIGAVISNSSSAFSDPTIWQERVAAVAADQAAEIEELGAESLRESWINPSRSKRISAPLRAKLEAEFAQHDGVGIAQAFLITNPQLPLGERLREISVPTLLTNGTQEERFQPLLAQARNIPGLEVTDIAAGHAVNAQSPNDWNAAATDFISRHS